MPAMTPRLFSCAVVLTLLASVGYAAPLQGVTTQETLRAPQAQKTPLSEIAPADPKSALDGKPKSRAARARLQIPLVGDPVAPDDFALRYYAAQKQSARVDAELARLHALYSNYEPPADLYEAPASNVIDEEPFWVLYAADRLDELKAAIAAKEREFPGWRPSADLASKMRRKELQLEIASLWKAEKIQDLVDYAKKEDLSQISDQVDVLWTIADAYARAKQNGDAVDMFKRIIATSKDPQIRVATIQKALASLRMADVETLLAAFPGASEGTNEFAQIAIDVARARIAAFLHDARPEEVSAADMQKFEAYARNSGDANQLGLVAWYDYKRRDFAGALEWFKLAIQSDGDAMIAHGLAHSLRALDRKREAEEVAYAWREPLSNNMILFLDLLETDLTREIPPYIEADRLARYARATMEAGSGEGAQALAWYAYNSCQWDVALYWFERGVAWLPKDATVYGYALTLQRLKKDQALYELANRYDGLFAEVIGMLFPDGGYHPPTPCDQKGNQKLHGAGLRTPGFPAPGPAMIPGAAPNYARQEIEASPRNASYPVGFLSGQEDARLQGIMRGLKGRFPSPVALENPLRFRPLPLPSLVAQRPPAMGLPPAADSPLRKEPAAQPAPLVARRVPGVGPMPYEKYGFNLLAGWNGQETASWPTYSQQIAPPGTQWAEQEADPAKAGIALFDARNPANARGLPPGGPPAATGYGQMRPLGYALPTRPPAPAYGQYPSPVSR